MKRQKQRHKHKESFSVLLIPNTGGKSRQFHVSRFSFRLGVGVLGVILLAVAGAAAWTGFQFTRQENVRRQMTQQKETIETLEAQMQALEQEKGTLLAELETMQNETAPDAENTGEEGTEGYFRAKALSLYRYQYRVV